MARHSFFTDGPIEEILNKGTTTVHVTALDGLVNVNSLFTVAVFVGLSLATPGQRSLDDSGTCNADQAWCIVLWEQLHCKGDYKSADSDLLIVSGNESGMSAPIPHPSALVNLDGHAALSIIKVYGAGDFRLIGLEATTRKPELAIFPLECTESLHSMPIIKEIMSSGCLENHQFQNPQKHLMIQEPQVWQIDRDEFWPRVSAEDSSAVIRGIGTGKRGILVQQHQRL
ncbi:hypothetical protein SUGI_0051140 [Cryptomeria japonica]|nr:hypothetical protein SUGI_0051140 [Cryptomeria japonica]